MEIQEYTQTAAAIAILRQKYGDISFAVTTTKGMEAARSARAEVKSYRVALEKLRVELKAPALERTRLIDAEAKRITADLLAIEEPIDAAIKAEERRKEEEKAAKARAETARLAIITARISAIRNRAFEVANQPASAIQAALDQANALELVPEEYQELMLDAIDALNDTRQALRAALDSRLAYDAEQTLLKAERDAEVARIRAEREEFERLRAKEAARLAEEARIAEEAQKAQEAILKAQREAHEAEMRAKREEQERQEREARQARQLEEARLQAERDAMERQRAELYAQQRAFEEQARLAENPSDPVADLKQSLNADQKTAKAIDEAYQRGYLDGTLKGAR